METEQDSIDSDIIKMMSFDVVIRIIFFRYQSIEKKSD